MARKPAKTVDDFRAAHDRNVIIPNKIRAALAELVNEGPENWEYEIDFLKRAGISTTDLALFRDQFSEYIVETPNSSRSRGKRVWFGSAKVAAKVRAGLS